jgi:hypothetical protein
MAHNSRAAPRTSPRTSTKPIMPHAGAKSVGTHGSNRKLGAARQAGSYYARKANRDGRQPLD